MEQGVEAGTSITRLGAGQGSGGGSVWQRNKWVDLRRTQVAWILQGSAEPWLTRQKADSCREHQLRQPGGGGERQGLAKPV